MHFRTVLLFIFLLAISAVTAAQTPDAPAQRLEQVQTVVNDAEETLADANAESALSQTRLQLQEARATLQTLQTNFAEAKDQLETDLNVLGPAPDNGEEPASVEQLRGSYASRIAEYDRLLVLSSALQQKIGGLLDTSAEQLRDVFLERTLARSPPPYTPTQLNAAFADVALFARSAATWAGETFGEMRLQELAIPLALIAASLLLFYGLNVPVRDYVAQRLWRRIPKNKLTRAGPPAIAITRTSTRILLGAIGLLVIYRVTLESGLLEAGMDTALVAIIQALFALVTANAISRGLFSPEREEWRIAKVSNETAKIAHRYVLTIAGIFTFHQIAMALFAASPTGAFVRLETLAIGLIFGLLSMTALTHLGKARPGDTSPSTRQDDEDGSPSEMDTAAETEDRQAQSIRRILFLAPAAIMVGSSLLGYATLARWIFEKGVLLAMLVGYLYLLRAFLGSWTLLAVERVAFGQSRNETPEEDIVGFWTRTSVDGLLFFAAIPFGLALLGMQLTEIRTLALNVVNGFTIGSVRIAPGNLLYGLFLVIVVLMLTRLLQRVLEKRILPMTRLNPGIRHSFKTLVGYVGLVFAFLTGVSAFGFDLSNLAIIAGALSVGIGFGLQSVVNNFVSGLILLFERPIKIGDWVITASGEGKVKRINVRSTEIETFDRCSIIVPNSELISSSVQNWTHKDQTARVIVPVGVAYNTDPEHAREVLLKCAEDETRILSYPKPYVYFADFADSALNLELRVFIRDAHTALPIRNDLRFKIYAALKHAKIEIPFPQRDLNIRQIDSDAAQALRA